MPIVTDDEIEVIKSLIEDWGWEYGLKARRRDVVQLALKLGLHDWAKWNRPDEDGRDE